MKRRRHTVVDELSVMDDVTSQETYDRIARMAKRMFEVDVVLITFVDSQRQWFKSHLGTDKRETDLEEAFCAQTIAQETTMVVEDALEGPRFAAKSLVSIDLSPIDWQYAQHNPKRIV